MSIIETLALQHSTSVGAVRRFSRFAPHHYKVYTIPKRSVGHRVIAHPSKELKLFQRALNGILSEVLPVHESAYAYRRNRGIRDNARLHLVNPYLLKMDFKNYFMSISPSLFWEIARDNSIEVLKEDRVVLERLLFWCPSKRLSGKLVLSVGAPTSPLVSNFIAYNFDSLITDYCQGRGILYTRYSDDLTFTSAVKGALFDMPNVVPEILKEAMGGYISVNEKKTVFSSKAHNRHVTGVTLTSDDKLSVGRDRKRYVSSLIHKFCIGKLPKEELSHAQGLLAFVESIEPDFHQRMEAKYSKDALSRFLKGGG